MLSIIFRVATIRDYLSNKFTFLILVDASKSFHDRVIGLGVKRHLPWCLLHKLGLFLHLSAQIWEKRWFWKFVRLCQLCLNAYLSWGRKNLLFLYRMEVYRRTFRANEVLGVIVIWIIYTFKLELFLVLVALLRRARVEGDTHILDIFLSWFS